VFSIKSIGVPFRMSVTASVPILSNVYLRVMQSCLAPLLFSWHRVFRVYCRSVCCVCLCSCAVHRAPVVVTHSDRSFSAPAQLFVISESSLLPTPSSCTDVQGLFWCCRLKRVMRQHRRWRCLATTALCLSPYII